jgi:ABC-type Zn uptake system ZnuABC Zn-binding protein ZnuA
MKGSTPATSYHFGEGVYDNSCFDSFEKIESPREELKNHHLFKSLKVILDKGIYDGLMELDPDNAQTIARFKQYHKEDILKN